MTNSELIEFLKQFPMDDTVGVLYKAYSDYSVLEAEDISYFPYGKNPIKRRRDGKEFVLKTLRETDYKNRKMTVIPNSMLFVADDGEEMRFDPVGAFPVVNSVFTKIEEEVEEKHRSSVGWCWII